MTKRNFIVQIAESKFYVIDPRFSFFSSGILEVKIFYFLKIRPTFPQNTADAGQELEPLQPTQT